MVWGSISNGSKSLLAFLVRKMNAQDYIRNILEPVAIPRLQQLEDSIFHKDHSTQQ